MTMSLLRKKRQRRGGKRLRGVQELMCNTAIGPGNGKRMGDGGLDWVSRVTA